MHGFWPFDILLPEPAPSDEPADLPPKRQRLFFLFCSAKDPDPVSVAECVEEYCDTRRPPDAIYLIAPETERGAIEGVLDSGAFQGRARGATRYADPPNTDCLLFDAKGDVLNRGKERPKDLDVKAVKRLGLTYLINDKTNPVYLTAPSSHHFVVPSESHAQTFFRVGSAMTDGSAIDFIAFCCLPLFADREVKNVYCDTGAISPVVYAVNALRNRIQPNSSFACPTSFKSYRGAKDFQFRDMESSLVLISLSITGSLAPLIRTHHANVSERDILTLFILHKPTESTLFVCDLRKHPEQNPDGFDRVETYPEEDCPLCAQGSTRILISTEQFLPGHGHNEQAMIRAQHSPEWLRPFLGQFVGTGVIRAHYRLQDNNQAVSHATAEVFFDLERLVAEGNFLGISRYRDLFCRRVDQAIPAILDRIICLDSPASCKMAEWVAARAKETLNRDVPVYRYGQAVEKMSDLEKDGSRATLVVAAAAASGRSLLSVAQLLRHIQKTGGINYLVGLARFSSRENLREVEANLTRGERPQDHGFFVVERVFLPLGGSKSETTWDLERRLLDELIAQCDPGPARDALEQRRNLIREASGTGVRGLSEDLFWPNAGRPSLDLRPGFAFFPTLKQGTKASQADVYFTMTAVLHARRSARGEEDSLFQQEHLRKVLSPRCFDRFNDGVIQASLLRAATLPELDYSIDENISREMWQVLDFIFRAKTADAGEAYREFLLAMALKRLRLRIADMERLIENHGENSQDAIDKLLWKKILSVLENRKRHEQITSSADAGVKSAASSQV
jgi:hypothetical protein